MATKQQSRSHRATEVFPAGEPCDIGCDDLPSVEAQCYLSEHYENRRTHRSDPPVTDDVVDTLLNNSIICRSDRDRDNTRYLCQRRIDGYEWTLVVADVRDEQAIAENWVLVTIYSNYHGTVGTTNKYFDRKEARQDDD